MLSLSISRSNQSHQTVAPHESTEGGFGATKTYSLNDSKKRGWASELTKYNATNGASWGTKFTYDYYVSDNRYLCRK